MLSVLKFYIDEFKQNITSDNERFLLEESHHEFDIASLSKSQVEEQNIALIKGSQDLSYASPNHAALLAGNSDELQVASLVQQSTRKTQKHSLQNSIFKVTAGDQLNETRT